uniref:Uncharacterized protein n=1 Tax=Acrobeloides nanus TaxID=290746 RepID=A0A914D0F7_9BILA
MDKKLILQKLNGLLDYLLWSTEENSIDEIDISFSTQILYEISRLVVPDQKLLFLNQFIRFLYDKGID